MDLAADDRTSRLGQARDRLIVGASYATVGRKKEKFTSAQKEIELAVSVRAIAKLD